MILALLLLGWELVLISLTRRVPPSFFAMLFSSSAALPSLAWCCIGLLMWTTLLSPLLGIGIVLVTPGTAAVISTAVASLAGLSTIGLMGCIGASASQLCILVATAAAVRRRLLGVDAWRVAGLWALPTASALLLIALAGGASLLASTRVAAGDTPGRTPGEGLRALGQACVDLIQQPLRAGATFSVLLVVSCPFSVGALALSTASFLVHQPLARAALCLAGALCGAAALLWVSLGLRLAFPADARLSNGPMLE